MIFYIIQCIKLKLHMYNQYNKEESILTDIDSNKSSWGRAKDIDLKTLTGCAFLLLFSPLIALFLIIVTLNHNGSIREFVENLNSSESYYNLVPEFDINIFGSTLCWVIFQLYINKMIKKTEKSEGQITPAGNKLKYVTNGFACYRVTFILYMILVRSSYIAKNWFSIFWSANIIGYLLAIFSYIKAHKWPSHPEDRKFSGNMLYDFFMGIELNPRIGDFDFKLFFNGRPGIIAWSIINISFACSQYEKFGSISNSMVSVIILQQLYVVDFFANEDWYLRTIDIAHDHFGYMLAWGDCVWLPFLYTLQAQYLSKNYVDLSNTHLVFVLILGFVGYIIFRGANNQKDNFRQGKIDCLFGKPIQYIRAKYTASNGTSHESKLMTSGWWGMARHSNYLGDLMMALSYGLSCGFDSYMPYFYFIYMCILLVNRCYRDEHRCSQKYGKKWDEYCRIVPNRIIPFIF